MMTLAVMVLGDFALGRFNIDLLPHLIDPEVPVRIVTPAPTAALGAKVWARTTRTLEVLVMRARSRGE